MAEFGKLRIHGSWVEQDGAGSPAPFRLENCTDAEELRLIACWNDYDDLQARIAQLETSLGHALHDAAQSARIAALEATLKHICSRTDIVGIWLSANTALKVGE